MKAVNVAIVGMACRFAASRDLAEFWAAVVNGRDPGGKQAGAGEEPLALARIMVDQALQDAGYLESARIPPGSRVVAGIEGISSEQEADSFVRHCQSRWGLEVAFAPGGDAAEPVTHVPDPSSGVAGLRILVVAGSQEGVGIVMMPGREAAGSEAQIYAMLRAQDSGSGEMGDVFVGSGVSADDVGLVDCWLHGALESEPIETELAAGMAGRKEGWVAPVCPLAIRRQPSMRGLVPLLRGALSLSNKLIPPGDPAEPARTAKPPFFQQREVRPWIHDSHRSPRRMLACECIGGKRYSLLLEEFLSPEGAAPGRCRQIKTELDRDSELLVFSGGSFADLDASLARLLGYLESVSVPPKLADVAYSLSRRFDPQAPMRMAVVLGDMQQARPSLERCRQRLAADHPDFGDLKEVYFGDQEQPAGKVACLFPGQGFPGLLGPYVEHLKDLCLHFPEVREVFDEVELRDDHPMDRVPTSHVFFPPHALPESERRRLRQRLASPRIADAAILHRPEDRDLSSFGVSLANWANWKLLNKFAPRIDMLLGQSYGELSALCAAGAIDFDEFIAMHWHAANIDVGGIITVGGAMALASVNAEILARHQAGYPDVSVAVHISPEFHILGGPAEQLAGLLGELRAEGVWTQLLPYPAIHTPKFTAVRSVVEPHLRTLHINCPNIPTYSALRCDLYPNDPKEIHDLVIANLDHPVLLWQTTRRLYQDGARILIQVGGGATMYSQAKTNIGAEDVVALSMDVDYRSALSQLNHLCGAMLVHRVIADVAQLYVHRSPRELDLVPEPQADADTPVMPFVGRVVRFEEGREILLERCLDLDEDLHLAHHLFVNAPGVKPLNERVPVLPMTMGLEWLAETAACLAPGYGLVGFEDVRASRWIELVDGYRVSMRAFASCHHYDESLDRLHIAAGLYWGNEEKPAIQGTVIFGRQYLETVHLPDVSITQAHPYPWPDKQVYEEQRLFHGPLFQCVAGETLVGERAASGYLEVLPTSGLFQSIPHPMLLTDPVVLDGVGQLIGLWAMEQGVYVFPISIRRLELYQPTPAVGTRVPVTLNVNQFSHRFLSADIELQDGNGGVWMRIQGWQDWVFHWSDNLFHFRRDPKHQCLSSPLELPSLAAGTVARQVSSAECRDKEPSILARLYLQSGEMAQFKHLASVPRRQMQWLLGRIAAKDAVRQWLLGNTQGEMRHPASFSIVQDASGCPHVRGLGAAAPRISIAHCGEKAIAVAHSEAIGVDLEVIESRQPESLGGMFTKSEMKRLEEWPEAEKAELATRIWCAKEAAGKAWGTGIQGSPKHYRTTMLDGVHTILVEHGEADRTVAICSAVDGCVIAHAMGGAKEASTGSEASTKGESYSGIG